MSAIIPLRNFGSTYQPGSWDLTRGYLTSAILDLSAKIVRFLNPENPRATT